MPERRMSLVTLGMVATLATGGCATHRASLSDLPDREHVGHFVGDQGGSWFRACGSAPAEPSWWVTFTGRSVEQSDQARAAGRLVPGQRHFVRWRAAVTTEGEVGPQGPGTPALLVRDVLELRAAAETDCTAPTAAP